MKTEGVGLAGIHDLKAPNRHAGYWRCRKAAGAGSHGTGGASFLIPEKHPEGCRPPWRWALDQPLHWPALVMSIKSPEMKGVFPPLRFSGECQKVRPSGNLFSSRHEAGVSTFLRVLQNADQGGHRVPLSLAGPQTAPVRPAAVPGRVERWR